MEAIKQFSHLTTTETTGCYKFHVVTYKVIVLEAFIQLNYSCYILYHSTPI